ncbi:MAG: hypothetical protein ACOYOU_20125, partial [Kiritimatiellia bacterium]
QENIMADQTAASIATQSLNPEMVMLNARDTGRLRELAKQVAELAARPVEEEKHKLWTAHNDLEPVRPLIFCDPENGWNEIITPSQLTCEGELAKQWEMRLRKEIFWGTRMGDDRVIEPTFTIGHVYTETDWGLHGRKIGGDQGGSYTWEAPLTSYDDFDKLRFPQIVVNRQVTADVVALAEAAFGDLLTVRLKTHWWWTLGMTWTLANLRGLEQMMLDMYDEPENLNRIMAFLRDGHLAKLDFLEQNGLLGGNADGSYVGSGGFGYTRQLPRRDCDPARVRTQDMWGFGESQETVGVAPDMFAEFIYPYQLPILERFGLNCYGCCEPLDKRWHVIKEAPRLRRVSASTWTDADVMAEQLGGKFIFSSKPNPTHLAEPVLRKEEARAELRRVLTAGKRCGCVIEVIMKDNHTLGNNPENAVNWCTIARDEIRNIWDWE